ncbi:hypothetical protein [Streptomyces specialis]|uniref:hypothetical protein n=1 Tax=Streptomyces specialis TaxID=498367 RepID=UPI00131B5274|nr:hypothetical protein [Streptomyces specialis]
MNSADASARSGPRRPVTHAQATAELRAAGYEPLETYPGNANTAWKVRCTDPSCRQTRLVWLAHIRPGQRRCGHRPPTRPPVDHTTAARELEAAGFTPLETYPGNTTVPWHMRCAQPDCPAGDRFIALERIRAGQFCVHRKQPRPRVTPDQAARELRAAGYEPLTPYPGRVSLPWLSRCTTCGRTRRTSLSTVRQGTRCAHRHPDARDDRPAGVVRQGGEELATPLYSG